MALSAAVSVLAVWLGLTLAFYISYPVSFFITALAFGAFIVSLGVSRIYRTASV
jgi:ABC-type Mn2+/Zn2+ transport system permease subunit